MKHFPRSFELTAALALVGGLLFSCGGSSTDQTGSGGSGGETASGGATGTGGRTSTGGASGTGSGGTTASGGAIGTGGTTASGGTNGSGGATGTGGSATSGGNGGTGGQGGAGVGTGGASGDTGGSAGSAGNHSGTGGGTAGNLGGDGGGGSGGRGGAAGGAGGVSPNAVVKIMAIGDSITRATCWRDFLWQTLEQNYASHFDLVGTLNYDYGCGVTGFDADNQGYSSSLITEVVASVTNARTCDPFCPALSDIQTALSTTKPDVLLMHWGTNDVWNGKSNASITSAYGTIIDALRAVNPSATILLAQILPMNVTSATCSGCSCAACPTAVPSLNAAITTFAAGKTTAASPVIVVDQYDGFDATTDTRDGVHPNTQGSQLMAAKWYSALTTNHLLP